MWPVRRGCRGPPPAAVRRGRPETHSPKQPAVVVPALPCLWPLGSPRSAWVPVCVPSACQPPAPLARPCFSFPRTCSLLCLGPEGLRPGVCGAKRLGREAGCARPDLPWKESGWPCFWGAGGAAVCLPGSPGLWLLSVPLVSVCLSQLYAWATNTPIISSKATGSVTADHEPLLCPRALPATVTKHRPAGSQPSPPRVPASAGVRAAATSNLIFQGFTQWRSMYWSHSRQPGTAGQVSLRSSSSGAPPASARPLGLPSLAAPPVPQAVASPCSWEVWFGGIPVALGRKWKGLGENLAGGATPRKQGGRCSNRCEEYVQC